MTHNTKHNRYEIGEWRCDRIDGWWAFLYIGGSYQIAETECRKACFPKGLCVTIEPTKYIFAGGSEEGVRIGFIQYPPFPEDVDLIKEKAIQLGQSIAEATCQWSFTIVTPETNIFYSRRRK